MNHYTYEQLTVGQREEFSVKIAEEMLQEFRKISGDENPLHNDDEFARRHHYPQRVVYGMLTASFLSTIGGVYLPGEKCLIQSVDVKFLKPVYVGDRLTVCGTVKELHDSVKQIVLNVSITNSDNQRVLKGIMKLGVLQE